VRYERITEIRPFSWRLDATGFGELWGNLPARQPWVLILLPTLFRRGPYRKLWLTPPDSAAFVESLGHHGVRVVHAA
jgi:hypothetical protein